MKKILTAVAMLLSVAATYAQKFGEVITEKPSGQEYPLYVTSKGYTNFFQTIIDYDVDGAASSAVFADDGSVYIYNPITGYETKSWLKGTLDKTTNIVTFKLPQTIYADVINDDEGFPYTEYIIACKMAYSEELTTYLANPADQDLQFKWDGKTLTMLDNQFVGIASTDGTWYGLGEDSKKLEVLEDKTVTPKNTDEALSYLMKFKNKDNLEATQQVFVTVEGKNLYIKGLDRGIPEAWIKGEINGDKVIFAGKQYFGVTDSQIAHCYFMPLGTDNKPMESVTMSYNAVDMSMTSTDLLTVNYGKNVVSTLDYFNTPTFYQWEEVKEAPAAPVIKSCTPNYDNEYTVFTITLPTKTEDGADLDTDKLYYNIYFDDNLFTFTTSPYGTFDEDMSDIPYNYSDQDYYITKDGNDRIIYIFKKDFKKLGVQCYYLDGKNKLKSKMTEWGETSSISNATTENGTVTWTDLSGRTVKEPANGIYIKTVKKADGTVNVYKHIMK